MRRIDDLRTTIEQVAPPATIAAADMIHEPPAPPAAQLCPYCQSPRTGDQPYCDDCGWIFPPPAELPAAEEQVEKTRLKDRYELGLKLGGHGELVRYRGLDHGAGGPQPVPVILLQAPASQAAEATPTAEEAAVVAAESVDLAAPSSDPEATLDMPTVDFVPVSPTWPSIAWEKSVLEKAAHSCLPRILDHFSEGGFEYLVEEEPVGQVLWDAWENPDATAEQRFGWLKQIAGALHQLHQNGAILEGLRPDIVVVVDGEQARLTDLGDLLPLPLPANPPIRANYYTAPELVLSSEQADARADLYSFGAMLYALHLGRELTELDFEIQGVPKSFLRRFPDVHPLFGRLVSKTFCREPQRRFPSDEAGAGDPTGFAELVRTLETCRKTFDHVRLDIAAWTTTGIVRTGNEDAFAVLHAAESREDELGDSALVLLADGMGGNEAGEVAAALAIQVMRQYLLIGQPPFAALAGVPAFPLRDHAQEVTTPAVDNETYKSLLRAALKEANKQVCQAARAGNGRRGMGCTAQVVYLSGRRLIVGHVGDSRTYHLCQGIMNQVTRDQTWVNRMVELGGLTPEEAEEHPRRSELQQAIGGHADVDPEVHEAVLKAGDWVLVCSDGLSNHIPAQGLKEVLQSCPSAEAAARRLVNLVNLAGATDNATVVVVRVT